MWYNHFVKGVLFMNFLSMLGVDGSRVRAILQPIVDVLNVVWIPVVSLLGTFGAIYSIILAVNMAKADSADKREASKKRIIGVLTTCITLIALIILLRFFKKVKRRLIITDSLIH